MYPIIVHNKIKDFPAKERERVKSETGPLLAGRVPDLQLYFLALHLHGLDHEVHPDGGPLTGWEHALHRINLYHY
jgi:hypothetical protein